MKTPWPLLAPLPGAYSTRSFPSGSGEKYQSSFCSVTPSGVAGSHEGAWSLSTSTVNKRHVVRHVGKGRAEARFILDASVCRRYKVNGHCVESDDAAPIDLCFDPTD